MAYKGWMQFGGNEVINVARTMAYVSSMMPRFGLYDAYDSEDLAVSVLDGAYTSPLLDEAPWVDPDLPETYGFAGLYPLSITGLDDDTRSARVTEGVGAGGATTAPRRATREVRVSGLLIGVDDLSVSAGMSWLKSALNGQGCRDLSCTGDDVCFMAATPAYEPLTPYGDPVDHRIEPSALRASGAASWASSVFTSSGPSGLLVGDPTPGVPKDTLTYVWELQKPPPLPGGPGTLYPESTLYPGDLVFPGAPVSTLAPGVAVLVGVMDEQGMLATATSNTSEGTISITVDTSGASKFYRPVLKLASGLSVTVKSVVARHREVGTVDQCITPLLRFMHEVTCTDGPRIVEEFHPSVGAMARVEFTLVADVPYVYGQTVQVASGDGAELGTFIPGAEVFPMATLPACTAEPPPPVVYDPNLPVAPPAPQPPKVDDPYLPTEFTSYAISVPGDAVPLWGDAVPVLALTTGNAVALPGQTKKAEARGIRVRMVPRPLGGFQGPEDLDPCSACDTFLVSYMPENSTLTIDGVRGRITLTQAGDRVTRAGHLVTDISGGPFQWSTLTCGTDYFVLVDVPATSLVSASLALAARES